jgi:hypothetical protein
MRIDCTQCAMYRSEHCDDCLVTALVRPVGGAVELDEDLDRPLATLAGAGLVPVLRFRPRSRGEGEPEDAAEGAREEAAS